MKQKFISRRNSESLILFFCGWGTDAHLIESYCPNNCDLACCYDYRDLDFNASELNGYKEIKIIAWSLGVWAASKVLPIHPLPVCSCIAINGTLFPIDNKKGIPPAIFQGTIDRLDEKGLRKFNRRMCNSAEDFETFQKFAPERTVAELKNELICIQKLVTEDNTPSLLKWKKVYISPEDRIFPGENQQNAWQSTTEIETITEGHYCPQLFSKLLNAYE